MVTPEQELRAAAGALMLTARAKRGKVVVEEWAAIRLLHLLPEIYQVPHIAENGEGTWTTEPAPPGKWEVEDDDLNGRKPAKPEGAPW